MFAQFEQDLVHFVRGDDRLDQHRRLDRADRNAQLLLRHHEDVIPQPGFEMALELRQVEIRAAAARDQLLGIVKEVETEVEDAAGNRLAVDLHVLFRQVPAARTHEQRGDLGPKRVRLALRRDEVDAAADGVAQIDVALDVVVPARRVGVLEVGHEHLRARVERVDDHLAVDRTGDLHAPVRDVGADAGAGPVAFAHGPRSGQEIRQFADVELGLPVRAPRQQLLAPPAKGALQLRHKGQGLRRQDLREFRRDATGDLDAGTVNGGAHGVPCGRDTIAAPARDIAAASAQPMVSCETSILTDRRL